MTQDNAVIFLVCILLGGAAGYGLMTWKGFKYRMRKLRAYVFLLNYYRAKQRAEEPDIEFCNRLAAHQDGEAFKQLRWRIVDYVDSKYLGDPDLMIAAAREHGFKE